MRLFHLLWLFILWLNMEKSVQQNAIKCIVPVIVNGYVPGDVQEYKEHEVLHFECNRQYKRTEGRPSKCIKLGSGAEWSPTPVCEPIRCTLALPPLEGTRYDPAFRNVFLPGDTLTVTCGQKYWIANHQDTSAVTTCTEEGEWTVRPICQEVICSNRRDPDVTRWDVYWGQRITLGETARYRCRSGYESTVGTNLATCTRDGWRPNPLCQAIKCIVPVIVNGYVPGDVQEYKEHEVLHFECNRQYKRTEGRSSKCIKLGLGAEWSPTPVCEPIKCTLALPPLEGTRYDPAFRNVFLPGDTLTVTCGQKYWISNPQDTSAVTTCTEEGEWTVRPICQEVICSNRRDPDVTRWDVYWGQRITLGETARYRCRSGYESTDGTDLATCTRDGWRPNPLCQEPVVCGTPPPLTDGDIKYLTKSQYSHKESVEYMCSRYYTMEGEPYRTCISGEWTGQLRCLKPCIVDEDDIRQHNITLKSSDNKYFTHDEIIDFRCARGTPVGAVAMRQRCNGGVILLPTCQ